MTSKEFVAKLKAVATDYKSLYVTGCFGAPLNDYNKKRWMNEYAANAKEPRKSNILNATPDTFGFDCVNLIKAILWGWCGDVNAEYGGVTYQSNGVPDIDEGAMFRLCTEQSCDFTQIEVGEAVWMQGHIGVYIGDGLAVECTPAWENKVQITACNCSVAGYHRRNWTKHGKLPWVQYPAKTIWRVQTGAYHNREYADAYLQTVRQTFPDAYMVMAGGMYKVQVGAFEILANADRYVETVKASGFPAFLTTEQGAPVAAEDGYTLAEFVSDIQKACGASVDGVAGPETLGKTPTLSAHKNSNHEAVRPVQMRLLALGYSEVGNADGEAGAMFTSAVAHFQKDNGCEVDGEITAGALTWQKLLGMS